MPKVEPAGVLQTLAPFSLPSKFAAEISNEDFKNSHYKLLDPNVENFVSEKKYVNLLYEFLFFIKIQSKIS